MALVIGVFALFYVDRGVVWHQAILNSLSAFLPSFQSFGDTWLILTERLLGVVLITLFTLALHGNFKR